MTDRIQPTQMLSIGALARAIGIPVETLRTWERRYGTPQAERTQSGHRRYSMDTLQKLRLVRTAIQAGHRASLVVGATEAALRELIETLPDGALDEPPTHEPERSGDESWHRSSIERCITLTRSFDGRALDRELNAGLAALGALRFLELRVAPLLNEIGERWSTGDLGVRHEHFASERIQDFLVRQWRPLSDAATGPVCVCATPAGEQHTLGLQMAAYTLALNNVRVSYLGANLPPDELANAVAHHSARIALLSAARGADPEALREHCLRVCSAVGSDVTVLVGGGGFVEVPPSAVGFHSLRALNSWAQGLLTGR